MVKMLNGTGWKDKLPVAIANRLKFIGVIQFPLGKIADQENRVCIGRPFAQHPSIPCALKPKIMMSVGKITQTAFACQLLFLFICFAQAVYDLVVVGLQKRVFFYKIRRQHSREGYWFEIR